MRFFTTALLLFLVLILNGCAYKSSSYMSYNSGFKASELPPKPDYSRDEHWAALPERSDTADIYPTNTLHPNYQSGANVDVFFVHPTIYTKKPALPYQWNARIEDAILNQEVDDSTIKYQASSLNAAGKIYAPRYRQAHISAFGKVNQDAGEAALSVAYEDVLNAFKYYMAHYNQGKPFIIAAHSQGTRHAIQLIHDMVDGKPLQKQLIVAYLIGMPVEKNAFKNLSGCNTPDEIGCVVSWRTFAKGFYPASYVPQPNILCTNPLLWTSDEQYAEHKRNNGGLLQDFNRLIPHVADAKCEDGFLRSELRINVGTKFFLRKLKNYHIADYNLFYESIRENAIIRSKKFLESWKKG